MNEKDAIIMSLRMHDDGYNHALEDFTRQLSVKLIELPLDDLIVADIFSNVKRIYQQLKK